MPEDWKDPRVAVVREPGSYSIDPPYNPAGAFPEYPSAFETATAPNPAYAGVRRALRVLGLDAGRFDTPAWNPLGSIIRPGHTVVIKPNFVLSDHYRGGDLFSIVTHPSVLRAVVDYCFLALEGRGRIIIADTPQMDCDFAELMERTKLHSIADLYRERLGFEIGIRDLRDFWFKYENENYLASQEKRHPLPGDPEGSVLVDLGERSAFASVGSREFYGADFDREVTRRHHSDGRHEYMMSKTILSADVLISVPKLKVHKKVGVTLNSKGFVGTVTNKNFLIHYSLGGVEQGGDQFPPAILKAHEKLIVGTQRFLYDKLLSRQDRLGNRIFQAIYTPFRKFLRPLFRETTAKINLYDGGNWHGNDSAWRMVSDLAKIIYFADRKGNLHRTPQRILFSIVDGLVGGEGNGPLFPDSRPEGIVLAGRNPLAVDIVGARVMGFQPDRMKWATDLLGNPDFDFGLRATGEAQAVIEDPELEAVVQSGRGLGFVPHPGWSGFLEAEIRKP